MIKKKLIFLLILLALPLISSMDSQLIVPCGGDEELIIGCPISDEQLIFLGGVPPGGAGGVAYVEEEVPFIPPEEGKFKNFLMTFLFSDWILIIGIILAILLFIIIWRKKKKKGHTPREVETQKQLNK